MYNPYTNYFYHVLMCEPPTYDCCWNHSFILVHLFHYKTLDFNIVIE